MDKKIIPNHILLPEVRRLIQEGQQVTLRVKGSSMLPFIRGDKDCVRLMAAEHLSIGDIVLAEISPGKFCMHRLIKMNGDELVMMGDGNLSGCELFHYADIVGKAVAVIHENGQETDCNSPHERRKALWWYYLLPFRRILLGIWKRLFLR